jgi:hypothetical protein
MQRAFVPFRFVPSRGVTRALSGDLLVVAVDALRAVIRQAKALEFAHQQIEVRGHHIALSTCVTDTGELIVELDLGDPAVTDRLVTEAELRRANEQAKVIAGLARQQQSRRR